MTRKTSTPGAPQPATGRVSDITIKLPSVTIFRIFASILIAWVLYQLAHYLLLILVAILIAVTLVPLVDWLEKKGLKRSLGQTAIIVAFVVLFCVCIAVVVPALLNQIESSARSLPALRESVLKPFPEGSAARSTLESLLQMGSGAQQSEKLSEQLLTAGRVVFTALGEGAIVIVMALYFMVDGRKIQQWLLAFFSTSTQAKLRATSDGMSEVTFAYVWGQAITSSLVTVFSLIVLSVLKVPGALVLSLLAGIFDILPILGFFLFTIPACLLALSVSPKTALIVGGLYLIYQAFENYFIAPKVYGQRLRLSTLTVLLGLLAGGILGGVPGALVALPLLAGYSVVERIWLKPYLHDGVSEKHERQDDAEFGEKA